MSPHAVSASMSSLVIAAVTHMTENVLPSPNGAPAMQKSAGLRAFRAMWVLRAVSFPFCIAGTSNEAAA